MTSSHCSVKPTPQRYLIGLDLGQTSDFTALCVLERPWGKAGQQEQPTYAARYLHRFQLGTPYTHIVHAVRELLGQQPLAAGATLVVDQTGVGKPVVEMLARGLAGNVNACLWPMQITAGHSFSFVDGAWHVAKRELASCLQVLLSSDRLKIVGALREAAVLTAELLAFRVKITPAGNEMFEAWRERDHDDLVLAVAMAAWIGDKAWPWETRVEEGPGRIIA